MNRHQRRKAAAKARKSGEIELSKKLGMFNKLGDECTACEKPFDKKDREMVTSWFVTVRQEAGTVRLYCPSCWNAAQEAVKEYVDGT